jgi:hypothetical protein
MRRAQAAASPLPGVSAHQRTVAEGADRLEGAVGGAEFRGEHRHAGAEHDRIGLMTSSLRVGRVLERMRPKPVTWPSASVWPPRSPPRSRSPGSCPRLLRRPVRHAYGDHEPPSLPAPSRRPAEERSARPASAPAPTPTTAGWPSWPRTTGVVSRCGTRPAAGSTPTRCLERSSSTSATCSPAGPTTGLDRQSVPFFYDPNHDVPMEVIPTVLREASSPSTRRRSPWPTSRSARRHPAVPGRDDGRPEVDGPRVARGQPSSGPLPPSGPGRRRRRSRGGPLP